jgi:hypothetical protein
MVKGRCRWIPLAGLLLAAGLSGCILPPGRSAGSGAPEGPLDLDLDTATARVDLAIDAANQCVGDYTRTYDSPTVTPGDLLDAALIECQPFFAAHRGAVRALAGLQLARTADRGKDTLAEQEAERYSNRFRRIVRDTGLAVLVQRRSSTPTLTSPRDEGELSL